MKVTAGCHGYMEVFVKLQQNTANMRFLMGGFLLRGSHLIIDYLVLEDLSDYYSNYYKYTVESGATALSHNAVCLHSCPGARREPEV